MFRLGRRWALVFMPVLMFAGSVRAQEQSNANAAPGATASQNSATPAPHPMRIRVGGNVQMANVTHRVDPVYPTIAQQANVSGTVVLHIIVATDGTVKQADYVSGPILLMRAAIDAVQQWRYRPTLLNGEPVEVDTRIGFVFALTRKGPETNAIAPPPDAPPSNQGAPAAPPATQAGQAAPSTAPAASDSRPARIRIGGRVEEAKLIHMVQPVYPEDAKKAKISGTVQVKAVISKDGSLHDIECVSGPDELRQAAMDAVKQWRYEPTKLAGEPIDVDTTIDLVFSLHEQPETPTAPETSQSPAETTGDGKVAGGPQAADLNPAGLPPSAPPFPTREEPARIKVGGKVMAANLVHQVLPTYPEYAKRSGISGTVRLHAVIAKDGTIRLLQYVSGPTELKDESIRAVNQWRYKPVLLNGHPVEVDTTIDVVYTLSAF